MFDACKAEFYLKIKHCGAAVPVCRAEAVEVTILLYTTHWRTVSSCSAGIWRLQVRRMSDFNCFCVSIYRLNLLVLCGYSILYSFIA